MSMTRYSDREIVEIIKREIRASNTDWISAINSDRDRAYDYYYGRLPNVPQVNTSDYISRDVFDAVESIREKLLRVFTSSRRVVRFRPASEDDVDNAKARTEYVHSIIMDVNNGYRLLQTLLQDALLKKVCCVRRYWHTERVREPQKFSAPEAQVQAAMIQGLEVESIDDVAEQPVAMPTPAGPVAVPVRMVSGTAVTVEDRSRVTVEAIAPECVYIDVNCDDINKARFICIRAEKTRADLVAEGFDPQIVAGLSSTDMVGADSASRSRNQYNMTPDKVGEDERELLTIYEAYLYMDADTPPNEPAQDATLWQVIICGDDIISMERVREMPFRFWSPLHIAHRPIGMSIADVTMDLQRTKSNVVRGIVDNVFRVNTGLRIANLSVIRNARDLVDNPIGGVIDSPDVGAINVVPQPAISPATGALLELLASEKEARTGDNRMAKGLENQNIITHQNSGDMVNMLMSASTERVMGLARSFAETLWRPLMLDVYRLGYENGYSLAIEANGEYQDYNPAEFPYSTTLAVSIALTAEECEKHAARLMGLHQFISSDAAIAPLYGARERYAIISEICDLLGEPNWMADPTTQDGLQRMIAAGQQQQLMQQVALADQQAKIEKMQAETARMRDGLQLDAAKSADKQVLDEEKFKWQRKKDVAEAIIETTQKRPAAIG